MLQEPKSEQDEIIDAVKELRNEFYATYDIQKVKYLFNTKYKKDKEKLIKEFHTNFSHLSPEDPARREILILLSELGIDVPRQIYLIEEEGDTNPSSDTAEDEGEESGLIKALSSSVML